MDQEANAVGRNWRKMGASLMVGLFVAYLDRVNLSVALPDLSQDMGFAGARFAIMSSWALTIFLIGYALANVLGGFLTRGLDPKPVVITCVAVWSLATLAIVFAHSVLVLLACRFVLGISEGIYWPQQSRFARAWVPPKDLTKANSLIQYYGQFLALALGFIILTPVHTAFGWRVLFLITGALGLLVIVPLYALTLRREQDAPYRTPPVTGARTKLSLAAMGGGKFLSLMLFVQVTQGMLFWGITLWLPLAIRSIGFSGTAQAVASAVPFLFAVLLAVPMASVSDRTGQRARVAALGLIIPGLCLLPLPGLENAYFKLALITIALGLFSSMYAPNFWSLLQTNVKPEAVGPVAGLMNGVGAGGGGTFAGFLVGLLSAYTGSYMPGFMVIGGTAVVGGILLFACGGVGRVKAEVEVQSAH